MKSKEVIARYDKVINDITKKVTHVNRGGCGVFAYELGKVLKENKVKFKYVMLFRDIDDKDYVRSLIDNNLVSDFNSDTSWSHIVVKVGRKYIDGQEIMNKINKTALPMSEEFLTKLIKKERYWNSLFDRTQKIKIKKILKKHLVE